MRRERHLCISKGSIASSGSDSYFENESASLKGLTFPSFLTNESLEAGTAGEIERHLVLLLKMILLTSAKLHCLD